MKKNVFYIIGLFLVFSCSTKSIQTTDSKPETAIVTLPVESEQIMQMPEKIKELLASMSLEDKCGEMTQLALDMVMKGEPYVIPEPQEFDTVKLKNVIVDLKVGSILNVAGHTIDRAKWLSIMETIQSYAAKKESKIPILYGIDAIHGVNYTVGGTLFPQQIAQAATWNPALVKQAAEITAYETRASYIPWNFSPVLDIGRHPLWPRFYETFGEDTHLASTLTKAVIEGYQGDNIGADYKVAACMKHFIGYSLPFTGKDRTPALIPERTLREYFIPTFKAAIEAGAATIMINSGEVNGIPTHADEWLLKDILRDELGFKGVAVSDWEDIMYLFSRHRVATDHKDAIRIAVNAGIDMSMVPMNTEFPVLLKELVEEGKVSMERIDEAVGRILTLKYDLGLFDDAIRKDVDYSKFGSEEHQAASLNATLEAITLLKNEDNILPLKKEAKILVTGPNANSLNALNGGWTHVWQGTDTTYNTKGKLTFLEALQQDFESVSYKEGTTFDTIIDIEAAVKAAEDSDVIIACLGELPYCEFMGNVDDIDLPQAQYDLVNALAETGKPIVLTLIEGRPRLISQIEKKVAAVLMAYLPGDEGGVALSKIILGEVNPSGKLPFTYPRKPYALGTYDYKNTDQINIQGSVQGINPQFNFGQGLSYTSFKYSNLKIDETGWQTKQPLKISVDVQNTGSTIGKEVVQLYINDLVASVTPSVHKLRGFEKIELDANETKTVSFEIVPEDLSFVGINNKQIYEPGTFEIRISDLTEKIELE